MTISKTRGRPGSAITLDEYFAGRDDSRRIFDALRRAVEAPGSSQLRVTRSQIAFARRRAFAWAWIPGKPLRRPAAPLVLTLAFPCRDPSPRWKEIVEPSPDKFTHHLELAREADIDDEVRAWLRRAWEAAA